jgi:glycine/D-amino acid oxidase-like deaminating enzyme/nitrite reductase/ring-hydroxylating ferredoxin subunit
MNVAEENTKSVWMDSEVAEAPALDGDQRADVVVIGSGIAGLSTAYELMARGRSVIILDRGRIGSGMTARTTAHLASALDNRYASLIHARGVDTARLVYMSQAAAINRIEAIQANERIACDFQRVDGFLLLAQGTPASELDAELSACEQVGVPVTDVRAATALHTGNLVRSLRFPDQARFHPLKYLAGLAQAIRRRGMRIFADTAVEEAIEEKNGVIVKTEKGTIRAADVVLATNSPIAGSATIHTKQAPYRTYALAATLSSGSLPDALYWDTADPYHYVRLQPHSQHRDLVIIGGEDHKSGDADDGEARLAALESWARKRLPGMGRVTHRWSGQVMEPADHVGFIGRNPGDKHRHIVTGDSGQGMTNGVIASMLLANLIVDGRSPWSEVYEPARTITKNVGEYLSENLTVFSSLAEYLTAGDIAAAENLEPGEGGIFRSGLKKVAACRDRDGRLHLHGAACTHMGCVVRWNALEQCWDCPCHGSQFAADGAALNGPAVAPLAELPQQRRRLEAAE